MPSHIELVHETNLHIHIQKNTPQSKRNAAQHKEKFMNCFQTLNELFKSKWPSTSFQPNPDESEPNKTLIGRTAKKTEQIYCAVRPTYRCTNNCLIDNIRLFAHSFVAEEPLWRSAQTTAPCR
jgi:hypothetical protein